MEIAAAIGFIIVSLMLLCRHRRLSIPISVVYMLALLYLVIVSREPVPYLRYSINPLGAIRRGLGFRDEIISGLLHDDAKVISWMILKGVILNIMLFIPFGFLLPSLFPQLCWWQIILIGLVFSLFIELVQFFKRLGYADVDDLINNTLGTAIGFLCYKLVLQDASSR